MRAFLTGGFHAQISRLRDFQYYIPDVLRGRAGADTPAPLPGIETTSVYSAPTVKDFIAACKIDQDGCVDEVGDALLDKMHFDGTANICVDQVGYGHAVANWLGSHPDTAGMNTEDGIYTALKALYPCQ